MLVFVGSLSELLIVAQMCQVVPDGYCVAACRLLQFDKLGVILSVNCKKRDWVAHPSLEVSELVCPLRSVQLLIK